MSEKDKKKKSKTSISSRTRKMTEVVKDNIAKEDQDIGEVSYRISVKPKESVDVKYNKKGKPKKPKVEEAKKEEEYEIPYVVLRKEVDGIAPLHKLNLIDKFKVAFRFNDIRTGKKARREAEAIRRQQLRIIKVEAAIRREVNKRTQKILDKEIQEAMLEIKVPSEYEYLIDKVLAGTYYTMFSIEEIQINPNVRKYVETVPRIFKFRLR